MIEEGAKALPPPSSTQSSQPTFALPPSLREVVVGETYKTLTTTRIQFPAPR